MNFIGDGKLKSARFLDLDQTSDAAGDRRSDKQPPNEHWSSGLRERFSFNLKSKICRFSNAL